MKTAIIRFVAVLFLAMSIYTPLPGLILAADGNGVAIFMALVPVFYKTCVALYFLVQGIRELQGRIFNAPWLRVVAVLFELMTIAGIVMTMNTIRNALDIADAAPALAFYLVYLFLMAFLLWKDVSLLANRTTYPKG